MSNISAFAPPTTIQQAPFCACLVIQNPSWLRALSYDPGRTVSVTVAYMRTLGLIGNQAALQVLQEYQADRRRGVQNEYQAVLHGLAGENLLLERQVSLETSLSETGESTRSLVIHMRDKRLLEGLPYYMRSVSSEPQGLLLANASALRNVEPLAMLTRLQRLQFSWCSALEELSSIRELIHLQDLTFFWCLRLKDLSSLAALTQLHSLRFEQAVSLRDLSPLSSLLHLRSLHISGAYWLTAIDPISSLPLLQHLDLSCCQRLTNLSPLAKLPQLQSLKLECNTPLDLLPLKQIRTLAQVNLAGCEIKDLTPLVDLPSLVQVCLPYELRKSPVVEKLSTRGVQIEFDGREVSLL